MNRLQSQNQNKQAMIMVRYSITAERTSVSNFKTIEPCETKDFTDSIVTIRQEVL